MSDLLKLIQERRSSQSTFRIPEHPVTRGDLMKILEGARWAPTPHNMQNFEVLVVDDKEVLERLGQIESRVSETFLKENYEQLSFSEEDLLRKKVGVLGTMFPPSFRDPKRFKETAQECAPMHLGQVIAGSPVLLIVMYDGRRRAPDSEGDVLGLVSLGCVMENMLLVASSLGISVRVLSDFGDPGVDLQAKRILEIPEHMNLVYGLRLGYPGSEHEDGPRVRRDIDDLVHHNRYPNNGLGSTEKKG